MSGALEVRGLERAVDGHRLLGPVSMSVAEGELVCVIGPSGSGKTTLLRCLAGLDRPDAGTSLVDGKAVPGRGDGRVSMVFEYDTLFPDLTVADNVGFGLRARGVGREVAAETVQVGILRLGLTGLEQRYPDELSGGQRRRVALARALVLRPTVLLLDEPLTGLDEPTAAETLRLIRNTQRRLGLTTLLVTHDQQAALATGDRIMVLRGGQVAQIGTPREVFEQPDSLFVAQFMGRSSFLSATVLEVGTDGRRVRVDLLGVDRWLPGRVGLRAGQSCSVLVRPHALYASGVTHGSQRAMGRAGAPDGAVVAPWSEPTGAYGVVAEARYLGDRIEYVVETGQGSAVATGDLDAEPLTVNDVVRLTVDARHLWVLPDELETG